jgi:hypothetical protein
MRHDVHGVAYDKKNGFWGETQDLRNDVLKDGGVSFEKIESGFSWLLAHSSGDDHKTASFKVRVIARPHLQWMSKGNSVKDVVRLRPGAVHILIHQHHFAADPPHNKGVSGSGPNESRSDNPDFHIRNILASSAGASFLQGQEARSRYAAALVEAIAPSMRKNVG